MCELLEIKNILKIGNTIIRNGDKIEIIKKNEAKVDIKKIIKEIEGGFGTSDNDKIKILQLFKGLIFSNESKAKEFMKKLDTATTQISKEILGSKKED